MDVINAEVGGDYTLPPAGNQVATCVGLYVIGTLEETFEGHTKKVKKLILAFELVNTSHVFKEGKAPEPFVMHKDFTHNLSSKSNLRKFLNSWAGKKLDDSQAKSFNLATLIGGSCLANVVHDKKKKDGSDIALLISASPVPEGMQITKHKLPTKIFNINKVPFDMDGFKSLPEWIQKKVQRSEEYAALGMSIQNTVQQNDNPFAQNAAQNANPFANNNQQPQISTVTSEEAKKLF